MRAGVLPPGCWLLPKENCRNSGSSHEASRTDQLVSQPDGQLTGSVLSCAEGVKMGAECGGTMR